MIPSRLKKDISLKRLSHFMLICARKNKISDKIQKYDEKSQYFYYNYIELYKFIIKPVILG